MRPRHLRFSGIRSYRHEASIDFDGHDLFAVIGDTGAGKSTIIEAMCLALYARKSWSGDSITDLVADGCDLMRVAFRFDAQGHTWEVTRARRRNGGSPVDKLVAVDGHTPTVDGSRDVSKAVEALLGLTCEQFTRAVVMPQGRFDELLRATPGQRNPILRSILGLGDVAATADAVNAVRKEIDPIRLLHTDRRKNLPTDPAAVLAEATRVRDAADTNLERLGAALETVTGPTERRERTAGALGPLRHALATVPKPGDAVGTLTACHARGADLLDQLSKVAGDEIAACGELDELDTTVTNVLAGFASRDDLAGAAARVHDAAAALPDDVAALEHARAARARLDEHAPAETVDPSLETAVSDAEAAVVAARAEATAARDRVSAATTALNRVTTARRDVAAAEDALAPAETAAHDAAGELATVSATQAAAADAVDAAAAAVDAARYVDAVAGVAAGHGPGDDCPVCARALPDEFAAPETPDTAGAQVALDAARRERDEADCAVAAATTAHAKAHAALTQARTNVDTATSRLADAQRDAIGAGADLAADDPTAALAAAMTAAEETVTAASGTLTTAQASLAEADAAMRAATSVHAERVRNANKEVAGAADRVADHARLVAGLPGAWATTGGVTAERLGELVEGLDAAAGRLTALASARAGVEARITTAASAKERIRADAAEHVTAPASAAVADLNAYLVRVRDVASAAAVCALAADVDVPVPAEGLDPLDYGVRTELLPDAIEAASAALAAATTTIDAARRIVDGAEATVADSEDLIARTLAEVGCDTVAALHQDHGQARSDAAHAGTAVAQAAADATTAAALDEILDDVVPFAENLEVLAVSLRDSNFVAHLLSMREQELLAEASRRLKDISSSRFGFVADFGVKNLLSGEIRSPDSLSGGERFQASLALALALVEIASRGGGRLDAVFVDEGFGSLDAFSLDTALATLGKVAGAGKMVGLISHLRPVAEYVDTVLHVVRDDTLGSRITVLDAEERDRLLADDIRSGLTV